MEALKQKYYSNRFAKKLEVKLKKQLAVLKRKGGAKPQETAEEAPAAPATLPGPEMSENVQPETENESELEPAVIGK